MYCTTGVILQWMRSNPNLDGYSHIVLDEIHERDILSDFLITILKDLLPQRPDLKVILMSATLNAQLFSKYFNHCPMINIPGFTFPVKELYLEDVLEITGFEIQGKKDQGGGGAGPAPKWHRHTQRGRAEERGRNDYEDFIAPYLRDMENKGVYSRRTLSSLASNQCEEINYELIATLVHKIHTTEGEGAILIFLPGESFNKLTKKSGCCF